MMNGFWNRPGFWPGVTFVSLGAGLLARELGYLPSDVRWIDFWPLLVVFFGLSALRHAQSFFGFLFCAVTAAVGALLLGENLRLLSFDVSRYWPCLLILLGISMFWGGGNSGRRAKKDRGWAHGGRGAPVETTRDDILERQVTFGGAEIRVNSERFQGGFLAVTLGGVELDLRHAELTPEGAILELRVLMGGVDVRVPDHFQVQSEVTPMLGGVDDTSRHDPRVQGAPRLILRGSVMFGGVTIRN
jgi:predicted membrane protein